MRKEAYLITSIHNEKRKQVPWMWTNGLGVEDVASRYNDVAATSLIEVWIAWANVEYGFSPKPRTSDRNLQKYTQLKGK